MMRTSRSISTISYNSPNFLKGVLDRLLKQGIISFYAYIYHYAEKDESKPHYHLYIEPAERIDTLVLSHEFEELSDIPDKPLKCMPFWSSHFDDWYLYVLHNKSYLLKKMQTRFYHYNDSDVLCSDIDYLSEKVHRIDYSKLSQVDSIIESVNAGLFFSDYALTHYIPIQQFAGYKLMYETLSVGLSRAGRVTHSPIDSDSNDGSQSKPPL